jgi:microcystin-dependent protein
MSLILPVVSGQLPNGFCPSTYQDMVNGFSAVQTVTFPNTFTGITVSSTTPADQTQAWLQLDSLGRPVRLYYFASGAWISMHPAVPGTTIIWTTTLPTFSTFDGGDANPLSAISGPMWEEVTALRAVFPIGVGTLPSGTAIAVGGTGGNEKVTLDATNMPAHNHQLYVGASDGSVGGIRAALQTVDTPHSGTDAAYQTSDGSGGSNYVKNSYGDAGGASVAHDNVPPYVGVYYLRRTNRLFYVA